MDSNILLPVLLENLRQHRISVSAINTLTRTVNQAQAMGQKPVKTPNYLVTIWDPRQRRNYRHNGELEGCRTHL